MCLAGGNYVELAEIELVQDYFRCYLPVEGVPDTASALTNCCSASCHLSILHCTLLAII